MLLIECFSYYSDRIAYYLIFFSLFERIVSNYLLLSSGECGTKRAEHEANGSFHVQRVEKARIRGWFPMAFSVH